MKNNRDLIGLVKNKMKYENHSRKFIIKYDTIYKL